MAVNDELLSISSGDDAGLMSEEDDGASYLAQVFEVLLKMCVLSNAMQAPLFTQHDLMQLDLIMDEPRDVEIKIEAAMDE